MARINWDTVLASLRVMGLGMAGIMLTALSFWGAIAILRRAFPPRPGEGSPRSDEHA
ncbi:MAG: hypothetical protein QME93_08640 [Bacillota bacterium]|nr:hypothetical protein [Bacillota bacterium]MDI7250120.1 hypothetical protein [Bacillota bacterium]